MNILSVPSLFLVGSRKTQIVEVKRNVFIFFFITGKYKLSSQVVFLIYIFTFYVYYTAVLL